MAKKGLGKGLNSLFNEEDIAEVFFEGYRDELEEKFCEKYQEMVDKIPYPRLHIIYDE